MNRSLGVALSVSLATVACGPTVRRPLTPSDAATRLEQVTRGDGEERDVAASPDGRSIAYDASVGVASPHVEVMALDGGRVVYTSAPTPGVEPAWMPDGSSVVFVSPTARSARAIVQTIGASPRRTAYVAAAGDPYVATDWPAVSPDGRTLAMSLIDVRVVDSRRPRAEDFDRAVGLTDLLGTRLDVLGAGSAPAWSPHGRRIAFARVTGGRSHLFVANADGSDAHAITDGPTDDERPAWSPDGASIAFCSSQPGLHANLFVVRGDGSGLVQLTEGDVDACRPSWGRDGFVYFDANVGGRFHVWRVAPVAR